MGRERKEKSRSLIEVDETDHCSDQLRQVQWIQPWEARTAGGAPANLDWTEPTGLNQLGRLLDDPTRRFVYLKRQVTPAVANYIGDLRLPGIHLLGHLLGAPAGKRAAVKYFT